MVTAFVTKVPAYLPPVLIMELVKLMIHQKGRPSDVYALLNTPESFVRRMSMNAVQVGMRMSISNKKYVDA